MMLIPRTWVDAFYFRATRTYLAKSSSQLHRAERKEPDTKIYSLLHRPESKEPDTKI